MRYVMRVYSTSCLTQHFRLSHGRSNAVDWALKPNYLFARKALRQSREQLTHAENSLSADGYRDPNISKVQKNAIGKDKA